MSLGSVAPANPSPDRETRYELCVEAEKRIYDGCLDVHALPRIFHYWSERHLRPKLLRYGVSDPHSLFTQYLARQCQTQSGRQLRFVSLGAGNCDLEVRIAANLRELGHKHYLIECLDLNPAMLARGRAAAEVAGVTDYITFVEVDLNAWRPSAPYDAAIANQSLHHVLNLEGLFDGVLRSLHRDGVFIISDIIGRNGHQRWPEAVGIVREFWQLLPPSHRFNCALGFYDDSFEDWDCSVEGFEGIRAQDILPLLIERFHFQLFIPFGNLIDPFIDRAFGPNFDPGVEWDRAFIDCVHDRDESEMSRGYLKPTHMLAVLGRRTDVPRIFPSHLSPEFCARIEAPALRRSDALAEVGYRWNEWPQTTEAELAVACRRLGAATRRLRDIAAWSEGLDRQIEERTQWALHLEAELRDRTTWALSLHEDLKRRTEWAQRLDEELKERTDWALRLDEENRQQANAIQCLEQTLYREKMRADRLENEVNVYFRQPYRFAAGLFLRMASRLKRLATGVNSPTSPASGRPVRPGS